jgi:hypothetical protein
LEGLPPTPQPPGKIGSVCSPTDTRANTSTEDYRCAHNVSWAGQGRRRHGRVTGYPDHDGPTRAGLRAGQPLGSHVPDDVFDGALVVAGADPGTKPTVVLAAVTVSFQAERRFP